MDTFREQETLKPYFDKSYGCAAFAKIAKGGIFVGGAYGKGDVYKLVDGKQEHVSPVEVFQAMTGWVLGGEVYSEIVFLETEKDFDNFMVGNFEFSADAKAVALTAAASAKASTLGNQGIQAGVNSSTTQVKGFDPHDVTPEYTKGMKVFTLTQGGLMYQATIGGQKFQIKK